AARLRLQHRRVFQRHRIIERARLGMAGDGAARHGGRYPAAAAVRADRRTHAPLRGIREASDGRAGFEDEIRRDAQGRRDGPEPRPGAIRGIARRDGVSRPPPPLGAAPARPRRRTRAHLPRKGLSRRNAPERRRQGGYGGQSSPNSSGFTLVTAPLADRHSASIPPPCPPPPEPPAEEPEPPVEEFGPVEPPDAAFAPSVVDPVAVGLAVEVAVVEPVMALAEAEPDPPEFPGGSTAP